MFRGLLFILLFSLPLPGAEIVDEVLATVDRAPVLHSDLVLAGLVGLGVPAPILPPFSPADSSRLLDHRIELELEFQDLRSTGFLHSLKIDLDGEVEKLAGAAGGEKQLVPLLKQYHLSRQDLEALAYRTAATRAWVESRLRTRVRVRPEDLEEAYRRHVVAPMLRDGTQPPPQHALEEKLHRLVEEEKLNKLIRQWLKEARTRHDVLRFAS